MQCRYHVMAAGKVILRPKLYLTELNIFVKEPPHERVSSMPDAITTISKMPWLLVSQNNLNCNFKLTAFHATLHWIIYHWNLVMVMINNCNELCDITLYLTKITSWERSLSKISTLEWELIGQKLKCDELIDKFHFLMSSELKRQYNNIINVKMHHTTKFVQYGLSNSKKTNVGPRQASLTPYNYSVYWLIALYMHETTELQENYCKLRFC